MKLCNFCGKPVLSETCQKIYETVKSRDERGLRSTAGMVAKELKISIQEANNFLVVLLVIELVSRLKFNRTYYYEIKK